jgi:hypothetical protein
MSFLFFRKAVFVFALLITPTISFAQEVFGTINATFEGEERTWFLTSQDSGSQSFGLSMAFANLQTFSLSGQSSSETVSEVNESLLLRFKVMSVGKQVIPLNISVTYLADGWKSGWLANEESGIVFSLTTLEKQGDSVFVEGSFSAVASYSENLIRGEIDVSRTMQIDGNFTATLPPYVLEEH